MSKKSKYAAPKPGGPLLPTDRDESTADPAENAAAGSIPESFRTEGKTGKARKKASVSDGSSTDRGAGRRSFVKTTLAAGIGAVAVGAPLCGAARMSLAPVARSGTEAKFYPLANIDILTEQPQKFMIVDDYQDAWTLAPQRKIGSVFLRKTADAEPRIQAFHTLCPHAGCMILAGKIKPLGGDTEEDLFYCPCHAAYFALDGKRLNDASPRDLDSLETHVDASGVVHVKYENFKSGITAKHPV